MPRFLVVLFVVVVALVVYSLVDLAMTDKYRVRALNKPIWVVVILLLPALGALLWLTLGKARKGPNGPSRRLGPDDDPAFLNGLLRDKDQDERIRRLEQELSELDDDSPKE